MTEDGSSPTEDGDLAKMVSLAQRREQIGRAAIRRVLQDFRPELQLRVLR